MIESIPTNALILILFVLVQFFGSFFNVVIYRLPKDESIVFPSSHCYRCKKPIKYLDNIPIFSFLNLGGKCRNCNETYSMRYLFVEVLTALLTVSLYLIYGLNVNFSCIYF